MEEYGQIKLESQFGHKLYELCLKNSSIKTVVEIGTWKGLGSTECIIRGLSDSNKKEISFLSLEAELNMHSTAVQIWKDMLPNWAKFVWGRIIDVQEMDDKHLGCYHPDEKLWFEQDLNAFLKCPNVLSKIPKRIDFLFLDGGEFSTYSEYLKLKDRSLFIGLDDTTSRKCEQIRNEVLSDSDSHEIILDNPWYRNGVMIFKNNKIS
jgi:hypothetical protein